MSCRSVRFNSVSPSGVIRYVVRSGATSVAFDSGDLNPVPSDQAGDGVVEGAALERQDFVLVAIAKEALHLVGMHG